MRISHETFGAGVILEEFVSGSGTKVARVVFDARPDEERTMLLSVLSESRAAMPAEAKVKPKHKPRAKKTKPEPVNDSLLCPQLDEAARLAPDFDLGFEAISTDAE